MSEIHRAVRSGNISHVDEILKRNPSCVNDKNEKGETPLHIVYDFIGKKNNDARLPIIHLLLDNGAEVNAQTHLLMETPLFVAIKKQKVEGIKLLLDAGADLNIVNSRGQTALQYTAYLGYDAIFKLLLHHVEDVNKELLIACQNGNIEIIKCLLRQGVNVNKCNSKNESALLKAVESKKLTSVVLLVKAGAQVNVTDLQGNTALLKACKINTKMIVKYLISHGADVNKLNLENESALFNATLRNNIDLVRLLVEAGAQVNVTDSHGNTALLKACGFGDKGIIKYLLKNGADVNKCNSDKHSPLYEVTLKNNFALVRLLVEAGADVNVVNANGDTPLQYACFRKNSDIIKYLISHGAIANMSNKRLQTPLHAFLMCPWHAMDTKKGMAAGIVELLLSKRVDVNAHDDTGKTALHLAVLRRNEKMVSTFLKAGAKVNVEDNGGNMSLHVLFSHRVITNDYNPTIYTICKLLIKAGADLKARNQCGFTPIQVAAGSEFLTREINLILSTITGVDEATLTNVDGNVRYWSGMSYELALAIILGYKEVADRLIEMRYGFETIKEGVSAGDYKPPLYYAARVDRYEIAKMILESDYTTTKCSLFREIKLFDFRITDGINEIHWNLLPLLWTLMDSSIFNDCLRQNIVSTSKSPESFCHLFLLFCYAICLRMKWSCKEYNIEENHGFNDYTLVLLKQHNYYLDNLKEEKSCNDVSVYNILTMNFYTFVIFLTDTKKLNTCIKLRETIRDDLRPINRDNIVNKLLLEKIDLAIERRKLLDSVIDILNEAFQDVLELINYASLPIDIMSNILSNFNTRELRKMSNY